MGQVVGITTAKENKDHQESLTVDFDNNEVEFKRKDWYKLKLAYCMSIHKAQGSEFKLVILPLVHQYMRMLNRNLLYTAITRAKDFLILLGELPAYQASVAQIAVDRETTLLARIREVFDQAGVSEPPHHQTVPEDKQVKLATIKAQPAEKQEQQPRLTLELITTGQIDPLIGMGNIRPADFM